MTKSAFVIGSTGIIGYNVALHLAQNGWTVYGLARSQEKAQNLTKHKIIPVIGAIKKDDNEWIKTAEKCDVIIEAMADYQDYSSSTVAREALLKIIAAHPNILVIYSSGVWVYGSSDTTTFDEDTPLNPIPLVATRPIGEQEYLKAGAVVVRPGCVFGKGGSLTAMLVSKFDPTKDEAVFAGTGEHAWASVHVDDLADAYAKLADTGSKFRGQVFNFVSGQIHIGKAAHALAKLTGFKGQIKFVAPADPFSTAFALNQKFSFKKSHDLLGWNPSQPQFEDATEKYFNEIKSSQQPHH